MRAMSAFCIANGHALIHNYELYEFRQTCIRAYAHFSDHCSVRDAIICAAVLYEDMIRATSYDIPVASRIISRCLSNT